MSDKVISPIQAAEESYRKKEYGCSLMAFAHVALELMKTGGKESEEQIKHCMEMTLRCFQHLAPPSSKKSTRVENEDLQGQFFETVKRFLDAKEEKESAHVEKLISGQIPLSESEERLLIYSEGTKTFELYQKETYSVAIATAEGPREQMEDQHATGEISLAGSPLPVPYFAVLDGHGGIGCAYFVKQKLAEMLQKQVNDAGSLSDVAIYNALRKTFITLDREWKSLPFQNSSTPDFSGTTTALAFLLNDFLWVANVGDSRVVVVTESGTWQLSEDAKPTVVRYAHEILLRGGCVEGGRVRGIRGTLDMARSIGDIDQPSVSALPEIRKLPLEDKRKKKCYLVIACDGLWDVVSTQMAAEVCRKSKTIADIAKTLRKIAFLRGTTDNVTILVASLGKHSGHHQ